MKKLLAAYLALSLVPSAQASDFATIKIRINGEIHDNSYFLCLPSVGCLSILAARKGKIFPVTHPVQMDSIYITNIKNLHLYSEDSAPSCHIAVNSGHTVTVSGQLSAGNNDNVHLNQLHCRLS